MVNTIIRGVCPWHVSLQNGAPWQTYELSSSSSSIIKEIKQIVRLSKLIRAAKKKKGRQMDKNTGLLSLGNFRTHTKEK
jgi:hypothetical protein